MTENDDMIRANWKYCEQCEHRKIHVQRDGRHCMGFDYCGLHEEKMFKQNMPYQTWMLYLFPGMDRKGVLLPKECIYYTEVTMEEYNKKDKKDKKDE